MRLIWCCVPFAAVGLIAYDDRTRAMALAAILAGDNQLEALCGARPELLSSVRAAANVVLDGPPAEWPLRVEAEKRSLLAMKSMDALQRRWSAAPEMLRPLPGLLRLIQATVMYEESLPRPTGPLSTLCFQEAHNERELIEQLGALSVCLIRLASEGERWAVHLVLKGAAKVCEIADISPRLAPAIVWIGAAILNDRDARRAMISSWPQAHGEALSRAVEIFERTGNPDRAEQVECRTSLERELSNNG